MTSSLSKRVGAASLASFRVELGFFLMPSLVLADTLQPVELADGVSIHLRVAGPAVRAMAWLIDLVIAICVYIAMAMAFGAVGMIGGDSVGQGLFLLALFFFNWFYNVFFEMGKKQATPGQRAMGVKVASVSGAPPRLPQSLIRNLLRGIDFLPFGYLAGLVCTLSNQRFQRLGDLVADTVVVYADEKPVNTAAFAVNATAEAPLMALNRAEQAAVLEFMERAPTWSDDRRLELAELLQPLTQRTGWAGLRRLCGIGLWLSDRGGKGDAGAR